MLEQLWTDLKGHRATPNPAHFRPRPDVDIYDLAIVDPEARPLRDAGLAPVAGVSFLIEYVKPDGTVTQRLLACRRLDDRAAILYLTAYCHLRGRIQTFRVDRIRCVADTGTGEVIGSGDAVFGAFLPDRMHESAFGWGLSVAGRNDLTAILNALTFVARCDREYHPLERAALEQLICAFWLRFEHDGEPDCASIMDYADRLAPDAETFWLAAERCASQPRLRALLTQGVRQIVDADGRLSNEEFYCAIQLDETLRALAA